MKRNRNCNWEHRKARIHPTHTFEPSKQRGLPFQVQSKIISRTNIFCNDIKQGPRTNNSEGWSIPPRTCALTRLILCGTLLGNCHTRYKNVD
ncbi:hypothetical protein ACS0TY_031552 [Phlomoides rotata]